MEKERQNHYEFRVVIDGIDVSDDVVQRINAVVQRAALAELASLDLAGDFRVQLPPWGPRPDWWGLWLDRIRPEQLELAGLKRLPQDMQGR